MPVAKTTAAAAANEQTQCTNHTLVAVQLSSATVLHTLQAPSSLAGLQSDAP
jgi:hypothetical protein